MSHVGCSFDSSTGMFAYLIDDFVCGVPCFYFVLELGVSELVGECVGGKEGRVLLFWDQILVNFPVGPR